MGKVIGGGLPAAAYGGPRELMRRIAPSGDVYQAGTLSGNPLAVAAGLQTLALLQGDQPYLKLAATTAALAEGLAGAAATAGYEDVQISTATGLLTLFFSAEPVTDYAGAQACDLDGLRGLVSRSAGARRVRAGVAVRGVVPVAGPHARAHRAHRRRRGGRVHGDPLVTDRVAARR